MQVTSFFFSIRQLQSTNFASFKLAVLQRRRPREVRARAQVRHCPAHRSAAHAPACAGQQDAEQIYRQEYRVSTRARR